MPKVIDRHDYPVLPLKNSVVFPTVVAPLSAGRPKSLHAIDAAMRRDDRTIVILAQKNAQLEDPQQEDLYPIGTKAVIKKLVKGEHTVDILAQGQERVQLMGDLSRDPFYHGHFEPLPTPSADDDELEALLRNIVVIMAQIDSLVVTKNNIGFRDLIEQVQEPLHKAYLIASLIGFDTDKSQAILSAPSVKDALGQLILYLNYEVHILELQDKIAKKAAIEMGRESRDQFLRQQLRAIQHELGEADLGDSEVSLLAENLSKANLPEAVRPEVERELGRLRRLSPNAPDYQLTRGYLELVADLPWRKQSKDTIDIKRVKEILDDDHFDLTGVKQRIIEHIAVLKLNPLARTPILCFVGPPGVGKTSLGQSIARAIGRKFERLSLGGLHDEAELRGHRRTYIGAMPGRIIQAIRRAGVANALLMLDEVDKVGKDFRGDPAAALLEILDPAQNKSFRDNYLDLPFDLSGVFFITTANTLDPLPRPLLDRMEVIRLSGYADLEKLEIAKRYLIPRQVADAGLHKSELVITDAAVLQVVHSYTREAGVRELERCMAKLCRRVATRFAEGKRSAVAIDESSLHEYLGADLFHEDIRRRELPAGVAAGMAWTEAGGDVLYVESTRVPDRRAFILTGQLGEVMKESARAALSCVLSLSQALGLAKDEIKDVGVHIHVPSGAIAKDGPSAGVTIATALASLLTGHPAKDDVAMTGEITLTGLIVPVGGVKEKVLAAHRAGFAKVIVPRSNLRNLGDIPEEIFHSLEFVAVDHIKEVFAHTLPFHRGLS